MRKIGAILIIVATLTSQTALAQTTNSKGNVGVAAQAGKDSSSDHFAWGVGLGALAVIGIVVGVVAGTASQGSHTSHSLSNFSH